jgi:hypothetical protein
MKDRAEVCPLSREVLFQPLSIPLPDDLRFFRVPLPALSSARLAAAYRERKRSGLPCFTEITEWVRSALSAGGVGCPRESPQNSLCPPRCLLAQACQHLWLVARYDVYQAFTYVDHTTHSSLRSALMLADPCVPLRFPRQYCY